MSAVTIKGRYKTDFLPGYTGHVPNKKEVYGVTMGEITRQVNQTSTKTTNFTADMNHGADLSLRTLYSSPP